MKNRTLGLAIVGTYLGSVIAYYAGSYTMELTAFDMIGDVLIIAWVLSTCWGAIRLIRT